MDNMVYTSKRGKQIVFDDYNNDTEYHTFWVEMCKSCRNKYRGILGKRVDDGNSPWGTCSVKGCCKLSDYYVDFDMSEVTFI